MIRHLLVVGIAVLAAASCTSSSSDHRVAGTAITPMLAQQPGPRAGSLAECQPDQVRLRTGGVGRPPPGRLMVIGFKLENHGAAPCNGAGYPTVVVQAAGHHAVRLHPQRGGPVEFGDPRAAKRLILRAGYEANFTIQMRPEGPNCVLANRAKLFRTTEWTYLAVDHRTVRVCPTRMREAALYPPAFLASLD